MAKPNNMQGEKKKYRIGFGWGIVLVVLAGIADLIGLIPFMETISGTFFWAIAGVILWMKGCGLLNWKRFVSAAISLAIGWVPTLQALPQLVAGIIAILILIYLEDKTGMSLVHPLSNGKKVRLPNKLQPLNQGGVRKPREIEEESMIK